MTKSNDIHLEEINKRFVYAMKDIVAHDENVKNRVQFAEKISMKPSNLYALEGTPKRYMTVKNIYSICQVFGVSPDWIILGKGNMYTHNKYSIPS